MKIIDEGFFLYSKEFGEKSKILYVFSKENGLIKGLAKRSTKQKTNLINFDKIDFTWSARNENALGYLIFEQQKPNNFDDYLFSMIKASASELCIRFLPLWEKNSKIYEDITNLSIITRKDHSFLLGQYVNWEINFLKHLGYGLNISICSVSGKAHDTYYISPKTGNAVSYDVGKKYSKRLFKIPMCMKENFKNDFYNDYLDALKITSFFFFKILENKKHKFIFRNQIINHIHNL